jgi:beta-lactamase superfamily II metal-dependent hydrolase
MKLTVFHSNKGDCLLLEGDGSKGSRMLIDGGMRDSYQKHVAPLLGDLRKKDKRINVVYVSHIDQDHISGVLQLLDDHVAWKVHDHLIKSGENPDHPEPNSPRPPAIDHIWHNAFHELLKDNKGPIGDLLAASTANGTISDIAFASQLSYMLATNANLCLGAIASDQFATGNGQTSKQDSNHDFFRKAAEKQHELATSIPEAIRVSQRISAEQLDISLNKHFGGKLAFVREDQKPSIIDVGSLTISVIGPFAADLDKLREDWNKWLRENKDRVAKLRSQSKRDAERLGTNDLRKLLIAQLDQAAKLGVREKVTPPNLASLMLLVEEKGKTLLLTGDGHSRDILKGLNFHKKLDWQGRFHVDVLKFPHHGSEHNVDEDFADRITADHYIFCGNGEHENPDFNVVELILNKRLRSNQKHPFKLWFNSSEGATERAAAKDHMRELKKIMTKRSSSNQSKFSFEFLDETKSSFELKF